MYANKPMQGQPLRRPPPAYSGGFPSGRHSIRKKGPHYLLEKFVSLGIEVESVRDEKFGAGLSIRAENHGICLDVFEMRSLPDKLLDHRVELFFFVRLLPPGDAGTERDVGDVGFGQLRMDNRHEFLEILENLPGGFARSKIVTPCAEEDHPGFVRKNDPVGEVRGIRDL